MAIGEGSLSVFTTRPLAAMLLVLAVLVLLGPRLVERWAITDADVKPAAN